MLTNDVVSFEQRGPDRQIYKICKQNKTLQICTFRNIFQMSVYSTVMYACHERTDFDARCGQLRIRSAEPPGEHHYEK